MLRPQPLPPVNGHVGDNPVLKPVSRAPQPFKIGGKNTYNTNFTILTFQKVQFSAKTFHIVLDHHLHPL